MMGGATGDGLFHAIEIHAKLNTSGANGIAEGWVDGKKMFSFNNVDYGGGSGWTYFVISLNQANVANGGCVYIDIDDIAISNTGYIGPLGWVAPAKPSPPTNVH